MLTNVQPPCSRARVALLEPKAVYRTQIQHEQRLRLALLLALSFLALSSPLSCDMRAAHAQPNIIDESRKNQLATYQAVLQLIDEYYFEERNVKGLLDSVMQQVLAKLDPHSYYQDPSRSQYAAQYFKGEAYKYGFSYDYYDGQAVIHVVSPGTPAAEAGLLPGDKINVLWGQPIESLNEQQIDDLLVTDGSVEMIVTRNAGRKRKFIRVERRPVYDRSVEIAEMIDKVTAYIYLSGFIASSYYEMKRALEDFTALGMKKLILDLRGNSGGLFEEAKFVASLFLPFHTKLVGVKGRAQGEPLYDSSYMPGRFTSVELVILVDKETASSAELVAGVLQDHDRAIIIGEQTLGKGVYQSRFPLPDGGNFALTTGRFYLPSGRCIQRRFDGAQFVDEWQPIAQGNNRTHHRDTAIAYSGKFLTAAGRQVCGGQGIIPELLVQNDTVPQLHIDLWKADVFDRLFDTILNLNAEKLCAQYKDARDFLERYQAKPELLPLFIKLARLQGVKDAGKQIEADRAGVLRQFKRWLCYRLFPEDGWKRSALLQDRQFDEAVKLLKEQLVIK